MDRRVVLFPLVYCLACSPSEPSVTGAPLSVALRETAFDPSVPVGLGEDGRPTVRHHFAGMELTVDDHGVLTLRIGDATHVLDREVIPEIAVSPRGDRVAYPRRSETGTVMVVRHLPLGEARVVSGGLHSADRPVFSPDGTVLVFWGSGSTDRLVGMYTLDLTAPAALPQRRNNLGIQRVDDPGFVEPPMEFASIRFGADGVVRYRTPQGEIAVQAGRVGP